MDKVTCIVVGAGPAGSACAYTLAKKGIEVVLLERGRRPGEKNVAGFVLFTSVLEHLIPDFRKRAPLERNVTRFDTVDINCGSVKTFHDYNYNFIDDPISFTAFRSKFDNWFAREAVKAGAELITGMTVTDLIIENDRVVGVKIDDDELYADVVVGADGIHSTVAEKSGLIKKRDPKKGYLVVKEILDLPPDVINKRFQLREGEGCCVEGEFIDDVNCVYTLYTNKDSVSMAIDCIVDDLKEKHVKAHELLEKIKSHPYMHSLLEGATLREYQAHMETIGEPIRPECLYGNGVLLCGEAGTMIDIWGTGVPPAMLSGMMAAEAIEMAIRKNDYSAKTLKNYINYLDSTSLWRTMYDAEKQMACKMIAADIMEKSMRHYYSYIEREPYPFWKNMYLQFGKDFTPIFIRWIVTGWLHVSSLYSTLYNRITKRFVGRYHDWKND
ncbi:MAG: FAD-dependent oxidoreductase [Desulfobacterales bacterium]|nr:FAD-dependent oxidoreductase [Desulfobacterales bacterium]